MAKVLEKPELLAPAGDEESLRAAVAAGADAVYFGLRGGFNARARADNFAAADLPRIFEFLHSKGVQGFVTFNTLVFDRELPVAEEALADIARAGADAIIVQDLGIARLARQVCPELPLHASTQMTISSPEAAAIAQTLGVTRVVLPRELSIEEIRTMSARTDLELECFVHGALCVSWSGQCLTSEALQHRSANRGQCAQSCRMPYDLIVDGRVETARGDAQLKYLLSPRDLAAYDLLPELLAAGVSCFKIEGRMKGPEYVANVVDKYRRALEAALDQRPFPLTGRDEEELRYSFSRSFSPGFLKGADHQHLVHGLYPGHRGVLVGRVEEVHARARHVLVRAEPGAPGLKAGDRILFDQGKPEDDEPRGGLHACDLLTDGLLKLVFGGPDQSTLDLRLVKAGDVVWKAKDAEVTRRMKRIAAQDRKIGITLSVRGGLGMPLRAEARDELGRTAQVQSAMPLQAARDKPLHEGVLREKLCAFGETEFELRRLQIELEGALALPPSELKRMRRALTEALAGASPGHALRLGFDELQLDFMELVGLGIAVEKMRAAGARVILATPRVQKPGEEGYDKGFERLRRTARSHHPPAPAALPQRALRVLASAQQRARLPRLRPPLRGAPGPTPGRPGPGAPGDRGRGVPQHRVQRAGAKRRRLPAPAPGCRRAPLPRRAGARGRRGDRARPAGLLRATGRVPHRPAGDRGSRSAGEVRGVGGYTGGGHAAARVSLLSRPRRPGVGSRSSVGPEPPSAAGPTGSPRRGARWRWRGGLLRRASGYRRSPCLRSRPLRRTGERSYRPHPRCRRRGPAGAPAARPRTPPPTPARTPGTPPRSAASFSLPSPHDAVAGDSAHRS